VSFDPDGDGSQPAGFGIFHKYVVTKVEDVDPVGGSPTQTWAYAYSGNPGWTYGDNILYAPGTGGQTWDQWRGYRTVTVTHGTGSVKTKTVDTFFQGLDGDHNANDTTDSVSVTDFRGTAYIDYVALKGMLLQSRSYDDAGTELSSTASQYWSSMMINGPGFHNAAMIRESAHYTRERISSTSPATWREREVDTTYSGYGLPAMIQDKGEINVNDNICTTIAYAENVEAWAAYHYNYMVLPDNTVTYRGGVRRHRCEDRARHHLLRLGCVHLDRRPL
jgi:hypothetical protein